MTCPAAATTAISLEGFGPPLRRALVSVSDKSGLLEFATGLVELRFELLSTGGTAKALAEAGLPVTAVEDVTEFPEMMGGRVKTLHPAVHGGILARPDHDGDQADMKRAGFRPIDLVCVNLYPFERTAAAADAGDGDPTATDPGVVEQIDIGGPAMIRAAAKNAGRVAVVTGPGQYAAVLDGLRAGQGTLSDAERARLAAEAFLATARYDAAIADWTMRRAERMETGEVSATPAVLPPAARATGLRYGENPHQPAALYTHARPGRSAGGVPGSQQLHGKELGFNNIIDAAAAWDAVAPMPGGIAGVGTVRACVVKHTNPCGFAVGRGVAEAVRGAIAGDPMAAYGGILAVSETIDADAAELIAAQDRFFEVVIAPDYADDAYARLRDRWANVRLLRHLPADDDGAAAGASTGWMTRSVTGGVLAQRADLSWPDPATWTHAAGPAPDARTLAALAVMEWTVRALSSNAVCLGGEDKDGAVRLFGAGAGQMDRVASCRIAIEKAGGVAAGSVAASDAFFPFPDGPALLIDAGVRALVHPGGSKRDGETFTLCDERGVTCMTTGVRRFRH